MVSLPLFPLYDCDEEEEPLFDLVVVAGAGALAVCNGPYCAGLQAFSNSFKSDYDN